MKLSRITVALFGLLVTTFALFALWSSNHQTNKLYAACSNNLKVIEAAKESWASEFKPQSGPAPTGKNLEQFLANIPECPCGGHYLLGSVTDPAKCSLSKAEHTHARASTEAQKNNENR